MSVFSFSFQNWREKNQISLSPLKWTFWALVYDWSTPPTHVKEKEHIAYVIGHRCVCPSDHSQKPRDSGSCVKQLL